MGGGLLTMPSRWGGEGGGIRMSEGMKAGGALRQLGLTHRGGGGEEGGEG